MENFCGNNQGSILSMETLLSNNGYFDYTYCQLSRCGTARGSGADSPRLVPLRFRLVSLSSHLGSMVNTAAFFQGCWGDKSWQEICFN